MGAYTVKQTVDVAEIVEKNKKNDASINLFELICKLVKENEEKEATPCFLENG